MRCGRIIVSGTILGACMLAVPAFAQYAGNPPQVSTPAEKQETRELNLQSVNGTYASPAALNGVPDAPQMSDRWQRYQVSLERYRESRAAYLRAMARYRAEREMRLEEQAY